MIPVNSDVRAYALDHHMAFARSQLMANEIDACRRIHNYAFIEHTVEEFHYIDLF